MCYQIVMSGDIDLLKSVGALNTGNYDRWNATSIGNNACIVVHCKDTEVVAHCKAKLEGVRAWLA